jgi:hypothetical protein
MAIRHLNKMALTTGEEAELRYDMGRISLADLQRMQTWPSLAIVPITGIRPDGAYVARKSADRRLFWQGKGEWVNIQYPDRGTPKIYMPKIYRGAPHDGTLPVGYFDDGKIQAGYIIMPVIPGGAEWVCIGTRIALFTRDL